MSSGEPIKVTRPFIRIANSCLIPGSDLSLRGTPVVMDPVPFSEEDPFFHRLASF
jgi:hypothetical protein